MKLAEALITRASCKKRGADLKQRMNDNAKAPAGELPVEDVQELLSEYRSVQKETLRLLKAVNKTNAYTEIEPGKTLADALAERDIINTERKTLAEVIESSTVRPDRYTRSEIVYKSTINVSEIRKQMDDLSKAYRELDTRIQALNWSVDLLN